MMRNFFLVGLALLLVGCSVAARLSAPPNLYLNGKNYPAELVPASLQTIEPNIFYVTDRAPVDADSGQTSYSRARSQGMAFGAAKVLCGWLLHSKTFLIRFVHLSEAVMCPACLRGFDRWP
ncbi:hypothetical protein [Sulfitobacter sp. SK012]|uniref:hypothetical protein n=1 Tax=Sulfitobacter sp. SK012 TaxID=1389005 RepID=UPI0013B447ED|nr:hypothetical protein [Sulfitobacter sp. SK012]